MSRKQIFFTSDWHIGHANVIKFDNRPFNDLEHMHKQLIINYNKQVKDGGVCYFLGDINIGSAEIGRSVISQLNGTKILILGNHDKGSESSYNLGFDVVLNSASFVLQNQRVTMSHCPLKGVFREDMTEYSHKGNNWHGEFKNLNYTVENEGQFHLHGHIHSPNGGKSKRILGRQFDVGVSANNYRPVHLNEIESWIMKTIKGE